MGSISAVRGLQRFAWCPDGLRTTLGRRFSAAPRGCIRASVRRSHSPAATAAPQIVSLSTAVSCSPFHVAVFLTDAATCLVQAHFLASSPVSASGVLGAGRSDASGSLRPVFRLLDKIQNRRERSSKTRAQKQCLRRLAWGASCTPSLRNYTQKESRYTCDQPRSEDPIYYSAQRLK